MNNKQRLLIVFVFVIILAAITLVACSSSSEPTPASADVSDVAPHAQGITEEARDCIECHATETHGVVSDWDSSRHAEEGVSCLDCHKTEAGDPLELKGVQGHEDLTTPVSLLVPPSRCAECHEDEVAEFHASGHERAGLQVEAKDSMQTLIHVHEGRENPELSGASEETGCMQCHGIRFEVDDTGHPSSETYPSAGIGNIYPNGEVGNCTVCHSRHSFDIAEARKPDACGGCHLGPDHPDVEIYENTKHGQIFAAEGEEWKWDSDPGDWEPGDYRAPTCATCHMSGIGDLAPTHNVTQRLYWNLWAKVSKERNDGDVMAMYYGDGEAGRAEMEQVCSACHSEFHTTTYFESGDKAVELYNVEYFAPAEQMRSELADAGLLKDNPWKDEFLILYYHLWHHEGRRARQGAMMGAPDWAHWHGFFILQQDLNRMQEIYNYRMENNEIEAP
jgi:hypothetical protein